MKGVRSKNALFLNKLKIGSFKALFKLNALQTFSACIEFLSQKIPLNLINPQVSTFLHQTLFIGTV